MAPGDRVAHRALTIRGVARTPLRRGSRRSSRVSRAAGGRSLTRTAASSSASGSPSTRRQISATGAAVTSVRANEGAPAWARSTNRRTAATSATPSDGVLDPAAGTANGPTGSSRSPRSRRRARLVARTVRSGLAGSDPPISDIAGNTCSQLSRTSSNCLPATALLSTSTSACSPRSRTPSAPATSAGTSAGSRSGASSTQVTPSRTSPPSGGDCQRQAGLSTPPGPVSVSSRVSGCRSNAQIAATSRSRPTSGVGGIGGADRRSGTEIGPESAPSSGCAAMTSAARVSPLSPRASARRRTVSARGARDTPFQILHAASAHPGPLCQRLLAEPFCEPKAAQERSKRLGSGACHGSGFGSPATATGTGCESAV